MSEHMVRLSFPAKPDYLLLARLALSGIGRTTPVSNELLADLKLALTEACGNCVRHAYPDGPGDVSVAYAFDGDAIEMIVEDQGIGLDTESAAPDRDRGERYGHVDHAHGGRRARYPLRRRRPRHGRPYDEAHRAAASSRPARVLRPRALRVRPAGSRQRAAHDRGS